MQNLPKSCSFSIVVPASNHKNFIASLQVNEIIQDYAFIAESQENNQKVYLYYVWVAW